MRAALISMIDPPIVFVAGLPRSGSTLLMNLLRPEPGHYVTPTNAVLDLVASTRDLWSEVPAFKAQGLDAIKPRIISCLRGLVEGFYREQFAAGKVVFDKWRGWLAYIEVVELMLNRPINVLVTVRDVRAIVASFEKLHQANPMTTLLRVRRTIGAQTIEGRATLQLSESGPVGIAVNRLRDALRRKHHSKVMMIPYHQLCLHTQLVMDSVHTQIGLPPFKYDPEHVEQITYEDDTYHGLPLHNIRAKSNWGIRRRGRASCPNRFVRKSSRNSPISSVLPRPDERGSFKFRVNLKLETRNSKLETLMLQPPIYFVSGLPQRHHAAPESPWAKPPAPRHLDQRVGGSAAFDTRPVAE